MFGAISGYSPIGHSYLNTHGTQQNNTVSNISPAAVQTTIPVQPAPPVREVISNDARFSIESLLDQHASDPAAMAVRMRIQPSEQNEETTPVVNEEENKSAQEIAEEGECQTCENRKYKDGSDDPGVSFKTATKLSPERAATAVRGHEMEHVVREQAKAEREGREVISQRVTISTAICPECGTVYASGGETTTVTRKESEPAETVQEAEGSSSAAA